MKCCKAYEFQTLHKYLRNCLEYTILQLQLYNPFEYDCCELINQIEIDIVYSPATNQQLAGDITLQLLLNTIIYIINILYIRRFQSESVAGGVDNVFCTFCSLSSDLVYLPLKTESTTAHPFRGTKLHKQGSN